MCGFITLGIVSGYLIVFMDISECELSFVFVFCGQGVLSCIWVGFFLIFSFLCRWCVVCLVCANVILLVVMLFLFL